MVLRLQAAGEVQQLQQQLASLRAKAADTARQLSAARTAAKEAGQGLAAEQARAQHQAGLLDELAAELDKARRCESVWWLAPVAMRVCCGAVRQKCASTLQQAWMMDGSCRCAVHGFCGALCVDFFSYDACTIDQHA
jgi:hypothetical protein